MMSELTVEQSDIESQVFEICDRLTANEEKLSNRIILAHLDGITSTSTVHAPFKKWRELREANKKKFMENLRFSDSLAEAIADEIAKHSAASDKRSRALAEAANEQTQEAIEDLRSLEIRLKNEMLLLDQAKKDKVILQKQLDEEGKGHQTLVKELRQQLEVQLSDNKSLAQSNESLRTDVAKAELKLEGNETHVAEVKEQNQALMSDNKSLNKEVSSLSMSIASKESTIAGQSKLVEQYENAQKQSQQNIQKLESAYSELSVEKKELRGQLDSVQRALSDAKEKLHAETKSKEYLQKTADEQSSVISKLTAQS
jgi:chromosome segregation ATPase